MGTKVRIGIFGSLGMICSGWSGITRIGFCNWDVPATDNGCPGGGLGGRSSESTKRTVADLLSGWDFPAFQRGQSITDNGWRRKKCKDNTRDCIFPEYPRLFGKCEYLLSAGSASEFYAPYIHTPLVSLESSSRIIQVITFLQSFTTYRLSCLIYHTAVLFVLVRSVLVLHRLP